MNPFTDNFSKQSATYRTYRPTYPKELFVYLQSLTPEHTLAWDCGTGNGQSAINLAACYQAVYATDPSEQQILHALPHENVQYKVERAEQTGLNDRSVDLVTVAQAVHWFAFDRFYNEVKRVLKETGVIAVWAYGLPEISADIDPLIRHFHDEVIGAFWQEENRLIEQQYTTIPFPFETLATPVFRMKKTLTRHQVLGLVRSWSATQKFIDRYESDPVEKLDNQLSALWIDADHPKEATWQLILKVGRNANH